MCNKPIGIFDSGLGGLTVLKEIHRMLPGENLVYFGDSKRAPYGTKSKETIVNFSFQDMRFLLSKGVKAVVIACNTISSNALTAIKSEFTIPITEVIKPGANAGADATKTGHIGVIATPATIESGAYEKMLLEINPSFEVIQKSCPLFVPLVEEGAYFWNSDIAELTAYYYLDQMRDSGIDTLILGCTHYPLLKNVIRKVIGKDVKLIDSAMSIAGLLGNGTVIEKNTSLKGGSVDIYTSDSVERFMPLCRDILGKDNLNVEHVDIEKY
ncbi:MAG: glutamate racemase [Clostridiales bacterium]|nr:glutamate racemase [Clostridiales bacterium]